MDLISDILSRLQMVGTLYFRTSFTAPWSIGVPSFENVARFHFVHKGRCLVRVKRSKAPVILEQGDLIIITKGAAHTLFCDLQTEVPVTMLDQVVEQSGFTGSGALVYGELGADHETQLVCGHFAFADDAKNLLIDSLPSHIHIRNYGEAAGNWMENTLKLIGTEAGREKMGGDLIAMKMSEIIFVQALRAYIQSTGSDKPVLAGFADPKLSRALAAIHKEPGKSWTLESLSEIAGMSRTTFSNRFSELMTVTPLSYITDWRMQIARQLLSETETPIIQIAKEVGYQSEAAFSRVFKKYANAAPASYRRAARR
ncbi:MAG: AraC family transcriptional regulator [Pseudomonadota bacterium]